MFFAEGHPSLARHTNAAAVGEAESRPFFDESRVPVETIHLDPPEMHDVPADQLKVMGETAVLLTDRLFRVGGGRELGTFLPCKGVFFGGDHHLPSCFYALE